MYLKDLEELKVIADSIPNTRMMSCFKVSALITLNMRWEPIMLNRNLDEHPYKLVSGLIRDAIVDLTKLKEISYIEGARDLLISDKGSLEENHHKLFQKLWTNFSPDDYKTRIERFTFRLKINGLGDGWLKGLKCIDFGCGHGNFEHALIRSGASYAYGVDYGRDNIKYAIKARNEIGVDPCQIEFKEESVYKVSKGDNEFDFAIQNGVFHHLENQDAAYKEVFRVLKPGGWFWVYTEGSAGIVHNLFEASAYILREIPHDYIISHLDYLNIKTEKRYHLGDLLNAIYKQETWDSITNRLSKLGFGNFRRLVGGFPTDAEHDVTTEDLYVKEKYGEGDLRLLAQKLEL